jgi:hypothetical protein
MIVEPAVHCNDVDCGSVVSSVCYESGVEVTDDFGLFVAKNHLETLPVPDFARADQQKMQGVQKNSRERQNLTTGRQKKLKAKKGL